MTTGMDMLVLTSTPENIAQVEPFVENLVTKYHIDQEIYGNILITLTEAVTNAIMHGNMSNDAKQVKIDSQKNDHVLAFIVSDEGKGFDYSSLPDPTAPENILKIGGRGVFLMKQLSDLVIFSNNGSTVEIHFKL